MTPFEEELKRALARQSPSPEFAARVLAAVEHRDEASVSAWGKWRHWFRTLRLAPVFAALLVMTGGTIYQEKERAARGEAAKEKLLLAMRIAGSKLQQTRDRVLEMTATEGQQ